ncbi:hypothetical protein BSKO_00196 [Bryopsis sp. KO-2023]|nr:hypothetical protein BSKO_00196 [Bryopsis sp. KO-2023]
MHPGIQDVHLAQSGATPFPSCSETDDEPLLCAMPTDTSQDHDLNSCLQGNLATSGADELRDNSSKREPPAVGSSMKLPEPLPFRQCVPQTPGLRVRFSLGRERGLKASQGGGEGVCEGGVSRRKSDRASVRFEGNGGRAGVGIAEPQIGRTSNDFLEDRQEDSSSTDTDEDGELIQRAMKAKEEMLKRQRESKAAAPKKRPRGGGTRPGGVSLKLLIDEGILTAGEGVLSLEYRGLHEKADLQHDGRIHWKENVFDSPSAFSIFIKRLVNPTRKADDGWKTVKFAGSYLDHYKLELAKKRFGNNPTPPSGEAKPEIPSPKRSRTGGGAAGAPNGNSTSKPINAENTDSTEKKRPGGVDVSVNSTTRGDESSPRRISSVRRGGGGVDGNNDGGIGGGVPDWLKRNEKESVEFRGKEGLLHSEVFTGDGTLLQPSLLEESMG